MMFIYLFVFVCMYIQTAFHGEYTSLRSKVHVWILPNFQGRPNINTLQLFHKVQRSNWPSNHAFSYSLDLEETTTSYRQCLYEQALMEFLC